MQCERTNLGPKLNGPFLLNLYHSYKWYRLWRNGINVTVRALAKQVVTGLISGAPHIFGLYGYLSLPA